MLNDLLNTVMENASSNPTTCNVNDPIELPDSFNRVVNGYQNLCIQTLAGEKGKTAQYFYQY